MKIEIYTDGSATISSKPGGWAWVLLLNDDFHSENSGYLEKASNNDSELVAIIKGLEAALRLVMANESSYPQENEITLKSDSKLALGWSDGSYRFKQFKKMWLYEELRRLMRKLNAKTVWVPAHSGVKWNERCDELANKARLGFELKKKKEEVKINGGTVIGDKKDGIFCFWYNNKLKVVDFSNNIVENYDRKLHGKRGSALEIRKERLR
jgi:ribonuclease HI